MLDPALLREHLDDVRARLLTRSEDHNADLDRLVQADHERRTIIPELETNRRARKRWGSGSPGPARRGRTVTSSPS